MPRWIIHEQYAHIPECDGYLPLSIAFAQLAVVKADADPFDTESLAAEMRDGSSTHEVLRWFVRLLQSGRLRSVSRALGGGPVTKITGAHWQADDVVNRFVTSQYCRAQPFDAEASADSWIFIDEADYLQIWQEHKDQALGSLGKKQQPGLRPVRSGASEVATPVRDAFLLGLPAVEAMVGLKKSTIYKMIAEGRFPKQAKSTTSRSLWRRTDILEWIDRMGTNEVRDDN